MLKTLGAAIGAALIAGAVATAPTAAYAAGTISGAGATFPAPVYNKWADEYKAQTQTSLNYQPIGSGGGIKQIEAGTVDFGASDKPLKLEDQAKDGLVMFPTVVGGVVPVMNLPGVKPGQVKLTSAQLADIYRGAIKNWNDPLLAKNNPGLKLPNLPITVVHRSDGSGTTFLFTSYLSLEAEHWASDVGANDSGLNGRPATAARATKASPSSSSKPRDRSATSNTPTPSRTR